MRPIDADALINTLQKLFDKREKEQIFTGGRGVDVTWNDAIYYIKSAPTVDAVAVVRCENCVEFTKYRSAKGGFCENICCYVSEDFYCADGKRKGGDE